MSKKPIYGFPCVEDPNDFSPDPDFTFPAEIEVHRLACATYGKPTYKPNEGCYAEFSQDGTMMKHVARISWGIGINLVRHCDGCGDVIFGEAMTCHECGDHTDYCAECWPKHEAEHDRSGR